MRRMPGRILGPIARGLRSVGYFISDVFYVASRATRDLLRHLGRRWRDLERSTRARISALAGVAVAAALVVFVVLPNAPCEFPGGEECAPADDALPLVPATALAYAHVNLDAENPQAERAAELAGRTPLIAAEALGRLLGLAVGARGEAPEVSQISPWFKGEAAFAVLPGTERDLEQVQLLEYADEDEARAYAESIVAAGARSAEHEGVEVFEDERGLAAALVDGFVAIGSADGVRAVIDAARGDEAETLAGDEVATAVLEELPADRLAEAYLSRDGVEAFVEPEDGPLAALEPLVGAEVSAGVAASLSVAGDSYRVAVRSALGDDGAGPASAFFAAFAPFEPKLAARLPADTLAYAGFGDPGSTLGGLLDQATARAPDIAAGLARLIANLRAAEGVDLEADLLDALGSEAALAVLPRRAAEGDVEPQVGEPAEPFTLEGLENVPYVAFLADEVDSERAREALARLQRPLIDELGVRLGAPTFRDVRVGDVTAHVLDVSRAVQFTYALADSLLVIANDSAAVEEASGDADRLADSLAFQRATESLPEEPSLLAYLDVAGLLRYAERAGLAEDPAYARVAGDLAQLETIGLAVTAHEGRLDTDLALTVAPEGGEQGE